MEFDVTTEDLVGWYRAFGFHLSPAEVDDLGAWVIAHQLRHNSDPSVGDCIVHCEVNLVWYLYYQSQEDPIHQSLESIYPYIGCTKLSCYPCNTYLPTFSEDIGYNFETKGSHDKIYPNWLPPGSHPKVLEKIIKQLLKDLWVANEEEHMNRLSDSTGESGGASDEELASRWSRGTYSRKYSIA